MPNIGTSGLLLIVLIALLLFGPSKLPELGRAFGRTLREFKSGAKELMQTEEPQPLAAEKASGSAALPGNAPKRIPEEREIV